MKTKNWETYLENITKLDKEKSWRVSLKPVYKDINELFVTGKFEKVEELIQILNKDLTHYNTHLLICFLTVTAWAKNKLPSRPTLVSNVETELTNRKELTSTLLTGLY